MNEILDLVFSFWVGLAVLVFVIAKSSIKFVPQNRAFVVERFGKYNKTMIAGLNFLVPFIDRIGYDRSLKEHAYDVPSQAAITRDNISLIVDGVLYLKVLDPYKASYGVENYVYAVTQLAQTTMRRIYSPPSPLRPTPPSTSSDHFRRQLAGFRVFGHLDDHLL